MKIIMGIDASTTNTGVSVFKLKRNNLEYYAHTLISAPKAKYNKKTMTKAAYKTFKHNQIIDRVKLMITNLQSLLKTYKPDVIIIEDTYASYDVYTVKMLNRVLGAVLGYAIEKDIEIIYKTPNAWRSDIGIKTRENNKPLKRPELKKQALAYVKETFNIDASEDEAEAICIGYSYKTLIKGE